MESKPVSIVFAELPGFTGLAGDLPVREFQELLTGLHDLVHATTRVHHGRLTSFSGDAFQVLFSTGKTETNHTIETVLEFRERLETFLVEKNLHTDAGCKAGIASGLATVAEIGSGADKRFTVMGQAVQFANRLCECAEPGQMLVNGDVFTVSKDQFEFSKLEPIPLRGLKEALPVYELLGRKRKKVFPETRQERKIASVMVGREAEFRMLEEQVHNLLNGQGAIINLVGKPGIGKSRLIAELKAQEWIRKAVLLEGRAQSMGRNLSFHPLIYILKTWAGILEEDPACVAMSKLHDSIQRVTKEQASEIFPFIATMMGLPLEGKHRERVSGIEGEPLEKLILKNLRNLLDSAAAVRPLVILLEDLHWADRSSILFLESLFRMVRQHPILFINIFRPGYEETGDYLLKYLKEQLPDHHSMLTLEPLNESESGELIRNLLNLTILPAGVNDLIIRKTEGNPFFIEEVIRSFIDSGIVEIHENAFRVTDRIHEADIPASINEVILARIDKLDEKTRELLKTASVIGRNFYFKVLEEAADTISELDERLEYLKEVQLISESKQKEEIEYLFRHALAQQATYESIVLNSKKELHLKIARSIEKVFAGNLPEFYGTLAYHYEKAENCEKAGEYLVKAGDEAMRTAAISQAIDFIQHALAVFSLHRSPAMMNINVEEIYFKLGYALHARGLNKEAIKAIDKALELYGYRIPSNKFHLIILFIMNFIFFLVAVHYPMYYFKCPPSAVTDAVFRLAHLRAVALSMLNPKRFFIETFYFARMLTLYDLARSQMAASLFTGFSVFFFWTGISLKISERILHIAKRFAHPGDIQTYLKYRYLKKMHEYHVGLIQQDEDRDQIILKATDQGACWEAVTYLLFSGFGLADSGKKKDCSLIAEQLLRVADTFENTHARIQYFRYLSYVFVKFREVDTSIDLLKEAANIPEKNEFPALIAVIHSNLSALYSFRTDLPKARESLLFAERESDMIRTSKPFYSSFLMAKVRYYLVVLKQEVHSPEITPKHLTIAIRELLVTAKKFRGILPEAMLLKSQVDQFLGNRKRAVKTLEKAFLLAKNSGAYLELSRICFELGKYLADPNSGRHSRLEVSSAELLSKAEEMFEEMNMQWDLEEFRNFKNRSKQTNIHGVVG